MNTKFIIEEKRKQIVEKIYRFSNIELLNAIGNIVDTYLTSVGYGVMVDKEVMVDSQLLQNDSDFEVLESWDCTGNQSAYYSFFLTFLSIEMSIQTETVCIENTLLTVPLQSVEAALPIVSVSVPEGGEVQSVEALLPIVPVSVPESGEVMVDSQILGNESDFEVMDSWDCTGNQSSFLFNF